MVRLTKTARKQLDGLPGPVRTKARSLCASLDDNPALGKKLLGQLTGLRSARLGRSHRIIYKIVDGEIIIMSIVLRRDSY